MKRLDRTTTSSSLSPSAAAIGVPFALFWLTRLREGSGKCGKESDELESPSQLILGSRMQDGEWRSTTEAMGDTTGEMAIGRAADGKRDGRKGAESESLLLDVMA
ncbi:hypothetical protein BT69DRAFT_1289017, partial [Atractiella rhizophila]